MRRLVIARSLLLGLLVLSPAVVEGQGNAKKANQNATVATEEDYTALANFKEIVGKVTSIEPTTKLLGIHVEYQKVEPKANNNGVNSNGLTPQQQQQLQQMQQQMQKQLQQHNSSKGGRTTPQQQQQHLMHQQQIQAQYQMRVQQFMAQVMASNYQTVTHSIDFELLPTEDVKVVLSKLPQEYDDKGNVVEHSKEELKKRKDTTITWAFKGKWEDLQEGQTVKLYLLKPKAKKKDDKAASKDTKTTPAAKDTTKDTAKDSQLQKADDTKGKDAKGASLGDFAPMAEDEHPNRPRVRMILINMNMDSNDTPLPQDGYAPKNKKNQ